MKPLVKISLFAVFFLALAGILLALYLFNMQHKDLQKVKPDYVISAVELQKAFEENETSAISTYVNKVLEITGIIGSVKTGEDNVLSIVLKTSSDFSTVICTLSSEKDAVKCTPGNQITIRGECSGFLMDVLMNNCVVL